MEVVKEGKNRKVIEKPTKCPTCGSEVGHKNNITGDNSAVIYCLNPVCPSITKGRIDRFLTSLDIKGIGENLIESLVNDMGVSEPADLYLLHQRRDKMANLMLSGKTRLGEKRADSVLAEIDKKRDLTISQLLGSLGIFGLGKRRVALIQAALPGKMDVLANWFDDTLVKNAKEAGVPNIAERIHRDLLAQEQSILKCIRNGVVLVENKPKVKPQTTGSNMYTICITGALSQPKKHFQDLIEKAGHVYTTSFSRAVTHLVAADPNSGSSKMKKAADQGTQVISEADLIKLIS